MMHVEDEGNVAFDDLVHDVQKQFLLCKEETSRKFIKLEKLIELAEQKLDLLMSIQVKESEARFANAFGWKAKVRRDSVGQHPSIITDSSCHLELRLPKLEEAEVSECLQDNEHQLADFSMGYKTHEWSNPAEEENAYAAYTGEPIYDEAQGEVQECWPHQEFILAALNKDNLYAPNPLQYKISKSERSEELEDYQEHPRYDEVPGEDKEDWHLEEILLIVLGLEAFSQHTQNLDGDNSTAVEGFDKRTDVRKPFAYVHNAVVAHVPKKIHFEKIGETELRRTSNEILSVIKEGLDQPKELKPEILASKYLTIQVNGPKLHCVSCLILASQDMVSAAEEVSRKTVVSTQQQLSVEILIHYKPITIFDPGGCLSCLYEVICLLVTAGRINIPSVRSTMWTWLFFKGEEC